MKEFIEKFQKTSFFQEILQEREVIAILLLGSRIVGVIDEESDYDLVALVPNGSYQDVGKEKYLRYKDKKVHWYYTPITEWYKQQENGVLVYLCPLQFYNLTEDFILYKNPKWEKHINFLLNKKKQISDLAARALHFYYNGYIQEIIATNTIKEKDHSKFLYHLSVASYFLLDEPLDIEFLKKIKRIRWQPVEDKYKEQAIIRLNKMQTYIQNNPINLFEEKNRFYNEWRNL